MNAIQGSYKAAEFATHLQSEIRRLDAQVDLFWDNEKSLLVRHGLRDGMAVLDCGCGPGRFIELLSGEFPASSFTGLEIDPTLVDVCRQRFSREDQREVQVLQGSAEAPGLPACSFDFITMRLVLEHIPDPVAALKSLLNVLKPGGRIAIISNDFAFHLRSWPNVAELEPLYEAYCASRRQDGGDPCLGRRLPILLAQAGLIVEGFEMEVAHSHLVGDKAFLQAEGVGIPAQLVESGFLDPQVFEDMIRSWKAMLRHPDHSIMRPLFFGVGRRQVETEDGQTESPDHGASHDPAPNQSAETGLDPNYVAPSSELEKELANLWQEAMELEAVGIRSNFFDLGGDSLMLEELQVHLANRCSLHLPMAVLFQYPTIEQLAAFVTQERERQEDAKQAELPSPGNVSSQGTQQNDSRSADDSLGAKAKRRRAALSQKKHRRDDRDQGG